MTPGPSSAPFGAPDHVHTSQHPDAPDPSHSGPSSLANQPKTCTLCGQQLDAPTLDPDRGQEARSATSAASAPSPSSFAFAPDPIAGQSRHSLHSAINAAAAAALSRHLDNGETLESIVVTDADGNPICSRCAAAAVRDVASPGQAQEQSPEPPRNAADDDVEMTDGSSPDDGERLTGPPRPPHHRQSSVLQEVREEDSTESPTSDRNLGDAAADTPSSRSIAIPIHTSASTTSTTSTTAAAPASSTISPRRRTAPWAASSPSSRPSHDTPNLSISVTNMGTGGDAAMPNPTDESEFPPLGRPGTSPVLRSPTSPTRSPTNDRGRMRFGSPPRGMQVDDLHSTSPILGRSGSFSRSLSYSTSGSDAAVASTSTPVVSFPQSSNASTVVHGFSPAQPRGRRSSSSGSIHVPAPVGAIPGAGKTRRPSVTRRLSRSSSSTAPTSLPFAAMAASSADLPACPIEEDPFGPSAVSRPRISTIPTHAISDTLFGSTASLIGLNMSGSMFRDASRAIKVLPSPFSHPNTSDDSRDTADGAASGIRIDETRWYDPLKPDPLQEICRVRSPPKGRGCLFPGALFQGTQKSGRNSYDVTVRIVNVDLEASHLCGYLNIRGLTEDWPELTTYFDAEIIGDRHGFVTGKWGATEADDLKHWVSGTLEQMVLEETECSSLLSLNRPASSHSDRCEAH